MFSIVAAQIYVPTKNVQVSQFSSFYPGFVISCLFDHSNSDGYKVISHCGFDWNFPDD